VNPSHSHTWSSTILLILKLTFSTSIIVQAGASIITLPYRPASKNIRTPTPVKMQAKRLICLEAHWCLLDWCLQVLTEYLKRGMNVIQAGVTLYCVVWGALQNYNKYLQLRLRRFRDQMTLLAMPRLLNLNLVRSKKKKSMNFDIYTMTDSASTLIFPNLQITVVSTSHQCKKNVMVKPPARSSIKKKICWKIKTTTFTPQITMRSKNSEGRMKCWGMKILSWERR